MLNQFLYPNDGDWPIALSILPFLAQGRALYVVLVYHRTSPEVDDSLLLLFAFGTITLIIAFALDEQANVLPYILKAISARGADRAKVSDFEGGDGDGGGGGLTDALVAPHELVVPAADKSDVDGQGLELVPRNVPGGASITSSPSTQQQERAGGPVYPVGFSHNLSLRAELNVDLNAEKRLALRYTRYKASTTAAGGGAAAARTGSADIESNGSATGAVTPEEHARLAIVLQGMKFQFPPSGGLAAALGHMLKQNLRSTAAATAGDGGAGGATKYASIADGTWAVNDLSLALSLGECFGLLGPNGAGSSWL